MLDMKRREFITLLGGAAASAIWPRVARAQPAKVPTIGFLGAATLSSTSKSVTAFVQRLRELGWIEDRTVAIEYRWAEGRNERYRRPLRVLCVGPRDKAYHAVGHAGVYSDGSFGMPSF